MGYVCAGNSIQGCPNAVQVAAVPLLSVGAHQKAMAQFTSRCSNPKRSLVTCSTYAPPVAAVMATVVHWKFCFSCRSLQAHRVLQWVSSRWVCPSLCGQIRHRPQVTCGADTVLQAQSEQSANQE